MNMVKSRNETRRQFRTFFKTSESILGFETRIQMAFSGDWAEHSFPFEITVI